MVELMVVVIILGVLAAMAIPVYTDYIKTARTSEAVTRLDSIMKASEVYYQRFGRWPKKPGVPNYLADFSKTKHFSYKIAKGGGGFGLEAKGLKVDSMKRVKVIMRCNDVYSEAVITVRGI